MQIVYENFFLPPCFFDICLREDCPHHGTQAKSRAENQFKHAVRSRKYFINRESNHITDHLLDDKRQLRMNMEA